MESPLTPRPSGLARRAWCAVAAASLAAPAWAARRAHGSPNRAAAGLEGRYAGRAEVQVFAASLAERRGLPERWVAERLGQARLNAAVRRLIMPPPAGTPKNWRAYRERFVEPRRTAAGLEFWREHALWLARAEERYGVPPEMVTAIIGVETYYGRVMGDFRVVDALTTLAFDFPPGRRDRSAFFRDELEELFVWCAREGLDPLAPRGSYAGAIGLPQFMPGSINRHAIDFDEDGHVDLRGTPADAIGSVARYFAAHGWQPGQPTHFEVLPPSDTEALAALRAPDIVPTFTPHQMVERGAALGAGAENHSGLLALVELENGGAAPSYVAGTTNFYAVTRYNWSSYYALAVITLAEALRAAR